MRKHSNSKNEEYMSTTFQGPQSNFEIGGRGGDTLATHNWGGGHKTL